MLSVFGEYSYQLLLFRERSILSVAVEKRNQINSDRYIVSILSKHCSA